MRKRDEQKLPDGLLDSGQNSRKKEIKLEAETTGIKNRSKKARKWSK
jgi:hypothetical protein